MAEVQRVPAPRMPSPGVGKALGALLAVAVMTLMLKPWGDPSAAPSPTPWRSERPATPAPTERLTGYAYDPNLYGPFGPQPEWSVWPAGVFVSVRYIQREANNPTPAATSPSPSIPPTAPPTPLGSGGSGWPAEIVVGPADHLLWLGLDTPATWTLTDVNVWRIDCGPARQRVPVTRLASRWGPHFTIIGIPTATDPERLEVWSAGVYAVETRLDPGGVDASFRLVVKTEPPHQDADGGGTNADGGGDACS